MESQEEKDNSANKSEEKEKSYSQKDLLMYCGITGLITGVIGYFIGESRGEKKAKEKFEFAVKKWNSKKEKRKKKDEEEQFEL